MRIYSNKQSENEQKIKILGVTIYKFKKYSDFVMRSYIAGIIKIKKYKNKKKYYLFGVQILAKNVYNEMLDKICSLEQRCMKIEKIVRCQDIDQYKNSILVAKYHEKIFPQFKNIHQGRVGVVVGSGPTLLHYNKIKNALHFCVNASFNAIEPDYWFSIDATNVKKYFEILKKSKFIKFIGQCVSTQIYHSYRRADDNSVTFIPDCIIEQLPNTYKFFIDHPSLIISRDIEYQPLPDLESSVFSALYFAIYTGCKKIYIVGCDSTANGYFNNSEQKHEWTDGTVENKLVRSWNIFKEYVEVFHPDVELISVNPVRLKGLFKDVYTQSYINENPELFSDMNSSIQMLDECETIFI